MTCRLLTTWRSQRRRPMLQPAIRPSSARSALEDAAGQAEATNAAGGAHSSIKGSGAVNLQRPRPRAQNTAMTQRLSRSAIFRLAGQSVRRGARRAAARGGGGGRRRRLFQLGRGVRGNGWPQGCGNAVDAALNPGGTLSSARTGCNWHYRG